MSRWLLLLAVCGSLCALPGSPVLADIPRDGAGTFKSEKGGYQLWIPAGWHVKEEVSDRSYHSVLSREEVSDITGRIKYGVTVIRLKDYHETLKFDTDDPEKIPAEFAVQLIRARGALPVYVGHERSLGGVWYHEFAVPIGSKDSAACSLLTLLINLRGTEWLQAMWEVPCDELDASHKEIKTITESLRVNKRWGLGG